MTILGIEENRIKCRFCDADATIFKTGSLEVINGYVVSARIFFVCNEHKDEPDFDRPLSPKCEVVN